ncbi:MAG TPA: glycoside hydrolase domain-containing protein [Bryobacteraceae bacterium]|nr:glycoside hydrolase domain-containing protein [Bryobacteraceae bacterium]
MSLAAFSMLPAAHANPVVWTAPSLHRVGMTDPAGSHADVTLSAARGEYESFQIVANGASSGLSKVNMTVSDLKGPGGQVIPRSSFTLYREKYMHVTSSSPNWKGSNQPQGPGWYADALIPFTDPDTGKALSGARITAVPFDVKAGNNQPVWVDLLVPRNAEPGTYSGTYTVTSDQGDVTGSISLKVWNFALPVAPALKSSFLFFQAGSLAAQRELLRNKISPLSTSPADQAMLMKENGLSATQTGPFSGADIGRCAMSPAPSVSHFKSLAAAQQHGLMLYDYSADEIGHCTNLYPTIRQWAQNMHQAGIKNLISMSPTPALYDDGSGSGRSAVDIWVLLPLMYNNSKAAVNDVLKKGDAVWSYNTLVQDAYSPKWLIDFTPVDFRIQPGFISQSLDLTGMLYWRVDKWPSDAWNNVNNAGTYSSANYPGEGMLVYPGEPVGVKGVVASMRLKWLRDGVEDYDYVQILKNLGREDLAMKIARSVGPDWTNWTRDPNAIQAARQELGNTIDQIANAPKPATSDVKSVGN